MTRTSRRDEMELPHSMRTPSRLPSFINDVERAKRPTVVERIAHEIQRPDLVERLNGLQGLGIARQHPFTGSAGEVQLHVAVHAMNALVVPAMALGTQPVKALPESPTAMAADHAIEGLDDRSVLDPRSRRPGVGRGGVHPPAPARRPAWRPALRLSEQHVLDGREYPKYCARCVNRLRKHGGVTGN